MLTGLGSQFGSLLAQPAALAIGAGLLAGAVTGTAVVASGVLSSPAPPQLSLVACPGDDRVVARVSTGQSMLVTARSGDGLWLELYIGEPGLDTGWARTTALRVTDPLDALPVGGCELAVASPGEPTPTPEITAEITLPPGETAPPTPVPTPTPRPTTVKTLPPRTPTPPPPTIPPTPVPTPTPTPIPTPVPTPVPDTIKPTFTNVSITGAYKSASGYYVIDCFHPSALIKINITDTGGSGLKVSSIRLRWKDPLGTQHNQVMTSQGGTSYGASINWDTTWPWNGGTSTYLDYWVTASDNAGNVGTTTHPPDSQHALFENQSCVD